MATQTAAVQPPQTKPILFLHPEFWQKLMAYTRICEIEISGFGFLEILPGNRGFYAGPELLIPKQECSGASTEIDQDDLGDIVTGWMQEGEEGIQKNERMKLWVHSHVGMPCNWSGTDRTQMRTFANGWGVALVVNKMGEYRACCTVDYPFFYQFEDLPVIFDVPENAELCAAVRADIEAKVKRPTVATTSAYGNGSYGGGNNYNTSYQRTHEEAI